MHKAQERFLPQAAGGQGRPIAKHKKQVLPAKDRARQHLLHRAIKSVGAIFGRLRMVADSGCVTSGAAAETA